MTVRATTRSTARAKRSLSPEAELGKMIMDQLRAEEDRNLLHIQLTGDVDAWIEVNVLSIHSETVDRFFTASYKYCDVTGDPAH